MLNKPPYLSVVVTARNDDHGGNLLGRMQAFVNAWIGQAKRHRLSSELIVVDWNPPQDRPPLIEAIHWPADTGPCQVRFIQVPAEIHSTYQHPAALPLYQMIAKNVAMRRSRGRFILATNIDIIFSDELVRFFAEEKLLPCRMYRMDRHDVMPDVPVDGSVEEQLDYCATHIIRVCAREGYFELTPDGLRRLSPNDIAAQDSGIYFGDGWYSIEQYSPSEKFRWVDNDAQVVVDLPSDPAPPLIFDLEPGPGVGRQPFTLQVRDAAGTVIVETIVARRLRLELQLPGGSRRVMFRLHVPMGGTPKSGDPRMMNFRVFSCNWAERRSSETETPKPRPEILTEARSGPKVYELTAQPLRSLLKRAVRFYRDTAGPVSAAGSAMLRYSRSGLLAGKTPLGRDVFDAANGVAPSPQRPPRAPEVAAVRPPWRARVVSFQGDALQTRSIDPAQIQRAGSNAAFLHTNSCGDFTLMAREHWFELRGYPEFDLYSFNIDSVLCYSAHHAGFREELLRDPMRCYHIEHGLGSGWTPEGQAKLFERLRAKGVSWVDYPEVVQWIDQMRRLNSPMIFNLENWGLSGFELPEKVVGCVEGS